MYQFKKTNETSNNKKFACKDPECELSYKTQKGLTVHTNSVHLGVKYACEKCKQMFSQQVRETQLAS